MIDDLTTKGITEPYRMFTSRAEYRLSLRVDNADLRLTPIGIKLGCVGNRRAKIFQDRSRKITESEQLLKELSLTPNEAEKHGLNVALDGRRKSAYELLSFKDICFSDLSAIFQELKRVDRDIARQIEIDAGYSVYLKRQESDIKAVKKDESLRFSKEFNYNIISGLSNELQAKLNRVRPENLGQAARIEGITPAALTLLLAHIKLSEKKINCETGRNY
jgi:tRNA uridine 5-carboxymethylaminomethyl modification enzyme